MQLKNSSGFNLVELAVTLGITGLMTLMFMRLSLSTYNQEAHLKYKASVNETLAIVQNSLRDPNKCTEMFRGQTISATGTELPDGIMMKAGTGIISLLGTGSYSDFEVKSIMLADSVFTNTSFDLVVTFGPRGITAFNTFFNSNADITKRITVVGVKQNGKVATCGPTLSDTDEIAKRTFCNNLGTRLATWNDADKKCVLNHAQFKCTPPLVPWQMRNTGELRCVHIASQVDYTKIFDFGIQECTSKNYAFYQTSEGKITVGCPTAAEKDAYIAVPLK